MDGEKLTRWILRCSPIHTQTVGLQRRLFGRGSDEIVLVRGRDREQDRKRVTITVTRRSLETVLNSLLSSYRKQILASAKSDVAKLDSKAKSVG